MLFACLSGQYLNCPRTVTGAIAMKIGKLAAFDNTFFTKATGVSVYISNSGCIRSRQVLKKQLQIHENYRGTAFAQADH